MPTVRNKVKPLRHTEEELERWEKAAKQRGQNYSTFVRETVNGRIEGIFVEVRRPVSAGSPESHEGASIAVLHSLDCRCPRCRGAA